MLRHRAVHCHTDPHPFGGEVRRSGLLRTEGAPPPPPRPALRARPRSSAATCATVLSFLGLLVRTVKRWGMQFVYATVGWLPNKRSAAAPLVWPALAVLHHRPQEAADRGDPGIRRCLKPV